MNITIDHRPTLFGADYKISTPACIYLAKRSVFSWATKITIIGPGEKLAARILGSFSFLRSKYRFEFPDGQIYRFECEKLWKGVFVCENLNEKFQLYSHKGLNYSIFQNDRQIASFAGNSVQLGASHYDVLIDDSANVVLISCMVLAIAESNDYDSAGRVTYDFGNLGPEDRKFDRSWTPN